MHRGVLLFLCLLTLVVLGGSVRAHQQGGSRLDNGEPLSLQDLVRASDWLILAQVDSAQVVPSTIPGESRTRVVFKQIELSFRIAPDRDEDTPSNHLQLPGVVDAARGERLLVFLGRKNSDRTRPAVGGPSGIFRVKSKDGQDTVISDEANVGLWRNVDGLCKDPSFQKAFAAELRSSTDFRSMTDSELRATIEGWAKDEKFLSHPRLDIFLAAVRALVNSTHRG
jgi:hypothetical protein